MSFSVSIRKHRFGIFFWGLVLIRAFFNAALPLMDKTEARYGGNCSTHGRNRKLGGAAN